MFVISLFFSHIAVAVAVKKVLKEFEQKGRFLKVLDCQDTSVT